MATEIVERLENNAESVPSQTVVTSSIVIPSTSTARSGRQDSLPKRRSSNDLSRQGTEESKRPRLDTKDAEVKKRGQRIFGMLMGTLTKFKNDSQNKSEAEIKRDQIVQKTQEKLKKEHEELVNKMKTEEQERRERIAREKREAEERRIKELRECWSAQKKNLANFLRTNAEPPLYYLPAKVSQPMVETIARQKRQLVLESTSFISHDIVVSGEAHNGGEDIEMVEHNNRKNLETKNNEMEVDQPEARKVEGIQNDSNVQSTSVNERMAVDEERSVGIKIEESVIKEDEPTDSKDDPVEY
ncbi:721_t:CDS:2 [Acaulospora morrowiae]|uniref:721_t:CDS:1 n=1 Tax=Acaulospora morrowiae TaxID=94023 RepID=A0A9N9CU69_9GLOM|nr:721_t:CDS:2 [Acaulospora morrowiae]